MAGYGWWERVDLTRLEGHLVRVDQLVFSGAPTFTAACSCGWRSSFTYPLVARAGADADDHLCAVAEAAE